MARDRMGLAKLIWMVGDGMDHFGTRGDGMWWKVKGRDWDGTRGDGMRWEGKALEGMRWQEKETCCLL